MTRVVHKHVPFKMIYHYPGGSPSVDCGTIKVNVCDNMSLSNGSIYDEDVTCPDCLKQIKKDKK